MTRYSLAADIGGTKTQIALLDENRQIVRQSHYVNSEHATFDALLAEFLAEEQHLCCAVLAIAGPVDQGKHCVMTNLQWTITAESLEQRGFQQVQMVNDLEATAWAMTRTDIQSEFSYLNGATIDFSLPVVVVSPGTGLGEACILPTDPPTIVGTEGGHKNLAPFNQLSAELIARHWELHDRPISRENVFSGSGLGTLFKLMNPELNIEPNEEITRKALSHPNSIQAQCIELFTQGIFAEAGDLILQFLGWGGVIIAGGIPPKIEAFFHTENNIAYIHHKSQYVDRLKKVPIALCYEEQAPLMGAVEMLRHKPHGYR